MSSTGIDTSALLTMLTLLATVWTLLPNTSKLSFRLCLSGFDWLIIWAVLLVINGFFFQPVLFALGVPSFGPWKWGFDQSKFQYLLFLCLAGYVYWRMRRTKLTKRNLVLFDELSTALLHAGKYEELGELLQRHLASALEMASTKSLHRKLADTLRPPPTKIVTVFNPERTITIREEKRGWLISKCYGYRQWLAEKVSPYQDAQSRALVLVRRLLTSRGLVAHLAITRPYLCLDVMDSAALLVDDFQDEFFRALLADESSILYSEMKNNAELVGEGNRLDLPEENRLARFYCASVDVADRLGVYRSVGEAVLSRIESDDELLRKLNGRLMTFQNVGKYRDPVFVGVWFFRTMVLEGLHQRFDSHLWLYYMSHFTRRLVDRARAVECGDEHHEFPTPLYFLLYEIVDSTVAWIRDAEVLTQNDADIDPLQQEGDHVYISFEAATAIGHVMEPILMSPNLHHGIKEELLTVVLHGLKKMEQKSHLAPIADVMRKALIFPYASRNPSYIEALKEHLDHQDHMLRAGLDMLRNDINAALGIVPAA